jgi:glycosyltransferase involved in cell wall biosynthesis
MKVMLVIGGVTGGGAERQWMLLARALLDAGHDVVLATMEGRSTSELELLVGQGLRWRVVSGRWFREGAGRPAKRVLGLAGIIARLRVLISRERPDVVYSALTITNGAAWCATRLGHADKLVWGIRGAVEPYPRFARAIETVLGTMAKSVPLAIANAPQTVELHHERGIRPRAWATVPNGFDSDEFRPDARRRALARSLWEVGDRPVIGCVARLTPVKEHPLLLRAFARILLRVPDAVLVLAGGGSPAAERNLRTLATELGVAKNVRFLGSIDDAATVYAGFDVHVLASSTEGLPNAIGEAMAAGVPCVGTDVGAVAYLIGDTGVVVPSGNEGALAEAIADLLTNVALRVRLGSAARQRVINHFSVRTTAARTVAAFTASL